MVRCNSPATETNGFLHASPNGAAAFDPVEAVEYQFVGLDFLDRFPSAGRKDWRSGGPAVLGELAAPGLKASPLLGLLVGAHVGQGLPVRMVPALPIFGAVVGDPSP